MARDECGFEIPALHADAAPDDETGARAMSIYQNTSCVFDDADYAALLFTPQEPIAGTAHSAGIPLIVGTPMAMAHLCRPRGFGAGIVTYSTTGFISLHDQVYVRSGRGFGQWRPFASGTLGIHKERAVQSPSQYRRCQIADPAPRINDP